MAKKKNRAKKEYVYEGAEDNGDSGDSASAFAEELLSSMDLDNSPAQETGDAGDMPFDVRHPHMHRISRGIKKVFGDSSSQAGEEEEGSPRSNPAEPTESSEPADSEGQLNGPLTSKTTSHHAATAAEGSDTVGHVAGTDPAGEGQDSRDVGRPHRRNRRKEKLAERERERARIIREAESEAESVPDKRTLELKGMQMMIGRAGLVEYEVQPDGHCLFYSLSDQLEQRKQIIVTAQELRGKLAEFIRQHPDDFLPYLIEDESGDVISVEKYTSDLENTPLWGGELEIMATSMLYEVPIKVYFASQAPLEINGGDFLENGQLHIAYYKAKFGLGAHYNSLRDSVES